MKPRDTSRGHLEALLVARALAYGGAELLLELVDRDVLSPTAAALLERMGGGIDEPETRTKAHEQLAERVRAITVYELLLTSVQELVALVNALPRRERAWERDLAAGISSVEAA